MREARPCYRVNMARRVDPAKTRLARSLRANATPEERTVWRLLSRFRPKFTRQLPIGPYVADLACREARLVVEIDGGQHAESAHDKRRDDYMQGQGWTVFRVWNNDVRDHPLGTAEAILAKAAECLGGTHPQPLPSRERRPRRRRS